MSRILKHIVLLLGFLVITFNVTGQWERVSTMISGSDTLNIKDFHFFNADEGIVLGRRIANVNRPNRAYILRTTDGAITWDTIQTYTDTVLVALSFPSEDVGYISAVYPSSPVATIEILKTTDGGQSWVELPNNGINQTHMVHTMHFYDEEVGIVSRSGFSWITHDGGDSWNSISTNPHGGAPFTSLEDGVFTGVGGAILLYSEDTCQNFDIDTISWGGSANNVTFHQNHFYISVSGNNGYSLGYPYFNFGIVVKKELNSDNIVIHHFPEFRTYFIFVLDEVIYVGTTDLIGNERHILKSEDGGNTWWSQEIIDLNTDAWLGIKKIHCFDSDTCIAADGYSIYKTTNGGGPLLEQVGHQVYLGTDENVKEQHGLTIYPNPATDHLNIRASQPIQEITIVDLNGRLVYSETMNDLNTTIQVGMLSGGVYMVHVQTEQDTFRRKIVKQ
jgi:photosystem II stability/assembly factor-like uncharacterized protein